MYLDLEMSEEEMWALWRSTEGVVGLEEVRARIRERLAEIEDEREWKSEGPKTTYRPLTDEEWALLRKRVAEETNRAVLRFLGVRDPIWDHMNRGE